jgi:hypothetical protein
MFTEHLFHFFGEKEFMEQKFPWGSAEQTIINNSYNYVIIISEYKEWGTDVNYGRTVTRLDRRGHG